jgi:hypothetical protein
MRWFSCPEVVAANFRLNPGRERPAADHVPRPQKAGRCTGLTNLSNIKQADLGTEAGKLPHGLHVGYPSGSCLYR